MLSEGVPRVRRRPTADRLRALWPLIAELVRPRRGLLLVGFALMVVNRVAGLVLPASTKFLVDDVIGKQQRRICSLPLVLAVVAATLVQGGHLVRADPAALQGRPAADRRAAAQGAGPRRPAAGRLLRRQQDRHAGLAHHDRRRGRSAT